MSKSTDLYKEAKKLIPGGTQLLSKRPEMFFPDFWPAYYSKSKGCKVWDLDDNEYIDMSYMGVGASILGYSDDDVNEAVKIALERGSMNTLNAPEEVELAKLLTELHPWADMVRYARTGGEAMSVAVRIARAKSKKDKVLFCGYHGWHDWYLSANLNEDDSLNGHLLPGLNTDGVPKSLTGLSFPFHYNNMEEFLYLTREHKDEIGVIVLESIRNEKPNREFLELIRNAATKIGAVLVVDEVSAGFRLTKGGAHLLYDLEPDIAVFAKGISNGIPMAAIIGKKDEMESAQDSFISSTYWTDRLGPAAALATIEKIIKQDVPNHLIKMGKLVKQGWKDIAAKHNLEIHIGGIDPISHFEFKSCDHLTAKTFLTQEMLKVGYLATNAFYSSYAHDEKIVAQYINSLDKVFKTISNESKSDSLKKLLKSDICHSGFKRLT